MSDKVLILRSTGPDRKSHGGFQWPESGYVEAPDWDPDPSVSCGNGLHGLLWGQGAIGEAGWAVFAKRLERGTYQLPDAPPDAGQVAVDPAQLAMILEGIDLSARRRLRYRRTERPREPTFDDPLLKGIDRRSPG